MTMHLTIVHWIADLYREAVSVRAADDRHGNRLHGANDLLFVVSVAVVVLGVVMVSQGVLLVQPAAHLGPSTHAALGRVERQVRDQDERPVAANPPADRVPPTPAPQTAINGATRIVAACPLRTDLD